MKLYAKIEMPTEIEIDEKTKEKMKEKLELELAKEILEYTKDRGGYSCIKFGGLCDKWNQNDFMTIYYMEAEIREPAELKRFGSVSYVEVECPDCHKKYNMPVELREEIEARTSKALNNMFEMDKE